MRDHPTNPNIRLVDGAFYAGDAHRHFQWMREHAPVYWDDTAGLWGIARYEDVLAVSRDPRAFCNAQGMRPDAPSLPYMINLDDPLHKQRRALVNKGFTPHRVADREPRIREVCVELIETARQRGRFDFVRDVAAWLPLIVIGDMLGVTADAHARLLEWSDEMLGSSGSTDPDKLARAQAAFLDYRDYQSRVLAERRLRPQNDLVSVLAHAEIDGVKLNDEEVLMESLLILIGGDETTRHVIKLNDLLQMKPTALFVNTSRAELLEEAALVAALNRGRPGMAAVDVFESEPILAGHPLLRLENAVCTPHIGYVEQNSYEMYFGAAFDNVVNFINGTPTNIVNPEALKVLR